MEDSSVICVSFPDSPVIEQEQTHIKTSGGEEIHITCAVEAQPPPSVDWYRDGSLVSVNSPGVVMNQAGSRYNLIILGNSPALSPYLYHQLTTLPLSLNSMNVCVFSLQLTVIMEDFFKSKICSSFMLTGQWSVIWSWSRPSQYEQFVQHLTCSD